jgi:predicted dehydrogenase
MDRKRLGVIGVGTWGELHVQTYQDHPLSEAVAVCDAARDRADEVARKWKVPKVCKDYRELVQLPEVDAVSVVTPDFAHADIVLAALEAGKDVLVEKPLATTLEDVERIEAAVERTGRKLMVDFHTRWSPHFYKAREAIVEGKIGRPRYVYYRLSDVMWVPVSMISWAGRSSVLWFLGSHCVDTLRWMLQDEVERVYSVSRSDVLKSKGVDTYDFVVSILEFRGGCVVTLENCWILPDGEPSIVDINCQIVGDAGRILIDGSHHRALQRYTSKEGKYPDVLVMPEIYGRPTGFAVESIRYFIDCLVQDTQPEADVKDGIAATKVLLAIEQSAREGEVISV